MELQTETQRLLNEFIAAPEDKQQGVVVITGLKDPSDEDQVQVVISMEGDARFLLRVLCNAQLKLIKEYKNDEPVISHYKKGMLPILKELADPEVVDRIQKKLNHVPFWDLVGQLRKFTR
mgnify:CR=1 FL=1